MDSWDTGNCSGTDREWIETAEGCWWQKLNDDAPVTARVSTIEMVNQSEEVLGTEDRQRGTENGPSTHEEAVADRAGRKERKMDTQYQHLLCMVVCVKYSIVVTVGEMMLIDWNEFLIIMGWIA